MLFASPFTCKSLEVARFLEALLAEKSLGVGPADKFRGVGPADTFLGVVSELLLLLRTSADGDGDGASELFLLMPDSWLCKFCSLLMDCDKLSSMSSSSSSDWLRAESGLKMLCGPSDRSDAWAPPPLLLPSAPELFFNPVFRGCKWRKIACFMNSEKPPLLPVKLLLFSDDQSFRDSLSDLSEHSKNVCSFFTGGNKIPLALFLIKPNITHLKLCIFDTQQELRERKMHILCNKM